MEGPMVELPRYKCHKEVHAAKITGVTRLENKPEDWLRLDFGEIGGYRLVSAAWCDRFKPEIGGYYVVYALQPGETKAYTSFSPADAFESGYTRV